MAKEGYALSDRTVARLLREELGYSLQANLKTLEEGANHPDRDRQFHQLNAQVRGFLKQGDPVISVDTKKKELVGRYYNKGQRWPPRGEAEQVGSHDFPDPEVPKGIPYGSYDPAQNTGWVTVGGEHDRASFAVCSIRRWWHFRGAKDYRAAKQLLICAESGGSNG